MEEQSQVPFGALDDEAIVLLGRACAFDRSECTRRNLHLYLCPLRRSFHECIRMGGYSRPHERRRVRASLPRG